MDIISYAGELISSIARHGWSVTTLVVALTALLRVNAVRKMLLKRLPKRFRTEDRLEHIAADVRAIKEYLGVTKGWDAAEITLSKSIIRTEKPSLPFGWMIAFRAVIAGRLTSARLLSSRNTAIKPYFSTGRNKSMREYLKKLGRTKFQAFLLMTVTNITMLILVVNGSLNLDADTEKYMPVVNIVVQLLGSAIYMWVEGSIDKAKVNQDTTQANAARTYHGE